MIKVIAFDLGGVLYTYNDDKLMNEISKEVNIPIDLVTSAWQIKINEFEKGEIPEEDFWKAFLGALNINYDVKRLHDITINHFKPIKETLEILNELRNTYTIGLLSNQTDWIDELEEKYHFRDSFNIVIISKEVGLRKPEKEIFKLLIKKSEVKPSEIVFIDDDATYKEAVESTGLNFICYKSPELLKADLKKLGIEI